MDDQYNLIGILSGSTLKIIACIFMTIDHIGLVLFPDHIIFRILGRLAFPIFAFFIAEGCRYSRHKLKRFLLIFSIGIAFLIFYFVYDRSIYGNIFLTFSISILLDEIIFTCKKYTFSDFKIYKLFLSIFIIIILIVALFFLYDNMHFEYGFFGMLLPVLINLTNFKDINTQPIIKKTDNHIARILALILGSILLSIDGNLGIIQFYCLLSSPILLLYNGNEGCKKLKYVFYIFYPAHLIVIEAIAFIIKYIEKK